MQKILVNVALAAAFGWNLAAQDTKAFLGRWDMVATPASGSPYPQWMELVEKDGKIEGRVQPRGGGWRKIIGAKMESGKMIVGLPAGQALRRAVHGAASVPGARLPAVARFNGGQS